MALLEESSHGELEDFLSLSVSLGCTISKESWMMYWRLPRSHVVLNSAYFYTRCLMLW